MAKQRPLILLIEDDRASADAMELVLRDWGADVVHGERSEDIANAAGADAQRASMIIADFNLPLTDGVKAATVLRKRAPKARVLVMSGSANKDALRAAKGAGFAFMPKPTPPRELIAWLERNIPAD